MIRLVASGVVSLVASAVALVVGAAVLDGMALEPDGFVVAVLVFTVVEVIVEPLIRQTAFRSAPALLGSSALVATLASLVVTVAVTDGLRISDAGTWVLATVLVWAVALVARFLLPFVVFKRVFAEQRAAGHRR
ncbi:MAG: phage holin family protein [Acidimicrobiia bacterium]|nr:phage holin family protein [Acidimicrobiia bacterium]